jgi:hypothetical protein
MKYALAIFVIIVAGILVADAFGGAPKVGALLPVSTSTTTPPAKAAIITPLATGTIAPDYSETQISIQREYLAWQKTVEVRNRAAAAALATMGASNEGTKTAAEVSAIETKTAAEVKVTETLVSLAAQQTELPIAASKTSDAQAARQREIELAQMQAEADAKATEYQRQDESYHATATVGAAVNTAAAPYTVTVEVGRQRESLARQKTGTTLLQVAGWGGVAAFVLLLVGIAIVAVITRWNRTAIAANQGMIMKDGDGKIWQCIDGKWQMLKEAPGSAGAKAPDGVPPIKPFPPIYSVKNPAPIQAPPLNEIEERVLKILHQSSKLYGKNDPRRIAGHRNTNGSGDTWDAEINALRKSGVEIATSPKGTFLSGTGMTRDDLIYKIETGEIQLN